jgi:hypothetical protein
MKIAHCEYMGNIAVGHFISIAWLVWKTQGEKVGRMWSVTERACDGLTDQIYDQR